jgi:Uma2 family endonuclease
VDIPTVPHCGRRPDFCYYASSDASGVDLPANRVYRPPTLAVEILSEGDENRDLVDKRDEYARAGIPHYWILDPVTRTITTLVMRGNAYEVERVFGSGERFTSSLFPGLSVPVAALFPP